VLHSADLSKFVYVDQIFAMHLCLLTGTVMQSQDYTCVCVSACARVCVCKQNVLYFVATIIKSLLAKSQNPILVNIFKYELPPHSIAARK
jgi:hypothetical protein